MARSSIRNLFGLFFLFTAIAFPASVSADTLYVGSGETYATIQAGIDAAIDGDEVVVRAGTYSGADNKDLDFGGKKIALSSESGPTVTIVDCDNDGRGFHFHSGETSESSVQGFAIRDCTAPISADQMGDPDWIPSVEIADNGGDFFAIRRQSRMRAYPTDGTGDDWGEQLQDTRLIGPSVWNDRWILIVPGSSLRTDADTALEEFIATVDDILFTFRTYSYEGYRAPEPVEEKGLGEEAEEKDGGNPVE